MSNGKHSPGPWSADVKIDKRFCPATGKPVEDSRSAWISSTATGFSICTVMPWPELEANANLIAAAPEMLDALEKLRSEYIDNHFRAEWLENYSAIEAVINKARGES